MACVFLLSSYKHCDFPGILNCSTASVLVSLIGGTWDGKFILSRKDSVGGLDILVATCSLGNDTSRKVVGGRDDQNRSKWTELLEARIIQFQMPEYMHVFPKPAVFFQLRVQNLRSKLNLLLISKLNDDILDLIIEDIDENFSIFRSHKIVPGVSPLHRSQIDNSMIRRSRPNTSRISSLGFIALKDEA